MNNRALTLSVIMALLAVFFVDSYVTSIEEQAKKEFGTEVLVAVAQKDIPEMETINETMLELKPIPKKFLEPAALSYTDERTKAEREMRQLSGNVAVVPIKKGEQITYNKITEPSLRTGLSPQVTPGRRAIAVPVNEVTGVAKLVKPGDRVDLIAIIDAGSGKEGKFAKTVLQDVVVLAVGRNVTNNVARIIERDPASKVNKIRSLTDYDGFASVTLEVEPSQAQTLALLMASGNNSLTLSLRNNDDSDRNAMPGVSMYDVMGSDGAKVKAISEANRRR